MFSCIVPRKLAPCDWLGITFDPMYRRSNSPTIATKLVSLNKLIRFSKEVMLLAYGEKL